MKVLSNVDLQNNELQNVIIQKLQIAPSPALEGQVYYNTLEKKFFIYNGTKWIFLPIKTSEIDNDSDYVSLTPEQFKELESLLKELINTNITKAKSINYYYPDEKGNVEIPEIDGLLSITGLLLLQKQPSWEWVQAIVQAGLGSKLFPVGYEFTVHNSDYDYDMVWRVVGHDHHRAPNKSLEHTMTLEMKNVLSSSSGTGISIQYGAPEALYYVENGLEAGTYNFTWNYSSGSIASGTYQFTIKQDIPTGGQIVIGTSGSNKALTACTISTYASIGAAEAIESGIVIIEGTSGESLGTIQPYSSTSENLNCTARVLSGSSNYAQCAIDQWLNSSATAGLYWEPQTVFDRPPSWATTQNGFLHGLSEDFLAAVQPAIIPCRTNSMFEINSIDGTEFAVNQTYELTRKFFLLSRPEIYDSWDSSNIRDGEVLEYYDGLTSAERIHRDAGGTARTTWLRSLSPTGASTIRLVNTDGTMNSNYARYAYGVAAACIIA